MSKFAAIDIGTNAARLLIGEVDLKSKGSIVEKISYVRIPLRLGEEVFESGFISKEKAIEFKKTLEAFKLLAEVFKVADLRVCATSAMREAENSKGIKDYIEKEVGFDIEIISGQQEADLIFSIFPLLYPGKDAPFIVIDVGGGSTEVSILEGGKRVAAKSFKVGTLRILKNKVSKGVWKEIRNWLRDHVDHSVKHKIYGTGGNINKAHKLLGGRLMEPISLKKLESLRKELDRLSLKERINQFQLRRDRADVIIPALDIYIYIIKELKLKELMVPKVGLVDGMVYDMFLRYSKEAIK